MVEISNITLFLYLNCVVEAHLELSGPIMNFVNDLHAALRIRLTICYVFVIVNKSSEKTKTKFLTSVELCGTVSGFGHTGSVC